MDCTLPIPLIITRKIAIPSPPGPHWPSPPLTSSHRIEAESICRIRRPCQSTPHNHSRTVNTKVAELSEDRLLSRFVPKTVDHNYRFTYRMSSDGGLALETSLRCNSAKVVDQSRMRKGLSGREQM